MPGAPNHNPKRLSAPGKASAVAARGAGPKRWTRTAAGGPADNPWLRPNRDPDPAPAAPPAAPAGPRTPRAPHAGVPLPDAGDRLPQRPLSAHDAAVALWVVGAHGGSGESNLARLIPGARAAQHAWPATSPDAPAPRVLLIARTHHHGLRAAQNALREWGAGGVRVELHGLVLNADAPGKLPRALRELADHVAGGAPQTWPLEWITDWRSAEPDPAQPPRSLRTLLAGVRSLTPQATPHQEDPA